MTLAVPPDMVLIRRLTPEEVLEHFMGSLKETSQDAYKYDFQAFSRYLGTDVRGAIKTLMACDAGQANAVAMGWVNAMKASGLSTATQARRLGTLRSFSRCARTVGAIQWTIEIKRPKVVRYRDTEGPSEESVHKMLAACGNDLRGLRDRIIFSLLYVLGLRRFEVCALSVGDYDPVDKKLRYLGKAEDDTRNVRLPPELVEEMEAWLAFAAREFPGRDKSSPIACRIDRRGKGKRLDLDGLDYVVQQIGDRVGVKLWPHALRHSAITQVLEMGHDVREARGFSRHTDLNTLAIYDDNRKKLGSRARADLSRRLLGKRP